jgi:hypothetical protein
VAQANNAVIESSGNLVGLSPAGQASALATKNGGVALTDLGSGGGGDYSSADADGSDSFWPWAAPPAGGAHMTARGSAEATMSWTASEWLTASSVSADGRLSALMPGRREDADRLDTFFASLQGQELDLSYLERTAQEERPWFSDPAAKGMDRRDAVFAAAEGQPLFAGAWLDQRVAAAALALLAGFAYAAGRAPRQDERWNRRKELRRDQGP